MTTLYAGPVAGAAVESGVSTLVGGGLSKLTDPEYKDSWGTIMAETARDTVWGGTVGFVFNGCKFDDDSLETVKKAAKECGEEINNPALQRKLLSKRKYYRKKGEKEAEKIIKNYKKVLNPYVVGEMFDSVKPKGLLETMVGDVFTYRDELAEANEVQREVSP